MKEVQDIMIKQLENTLVVFKNLFRELGEQAKLRNLTIDEYTEQENGDYKTTVDKIKNVIDGIPDGLDKQVLIESLQEILDLINSYNKKQE